MEELNNFIRQADIHSLSLLSQKGVYLNYKDRRNVEDNIKNCCAIIMRLTALLNDQIK